MVALSYGQGNDSSRSAQISCYINYQKQIRRPKFLMVVPQSPVQKFPHSLKAKTTITAKGSPISSTVRGARRNWRKSVSLSIRIITNKEAHTYPIPQRSPNRTRGNDLPEPTIVLTDKVRNYELIS